MKIEQIGVQAYTFRQHLGTKSEVAASLKKVRSIGYRAVELYSLAGMTTSEMKEIIDGEGLRCCSIHEPCETIRKNAEVIVEQLEQLDCRYAVCGYPQGVDFGSESSVSEFIEDLERAGKYLAEHGKALCYHNHGIEFRHFKGRPALDSIYKNAPHLQGEIDTYWVQYGGGNPVE